MVFEALDKVCCMINDLWKWELGVAQQNSSAEIKTGKLLRLVM